VLSEGAYEDEKPIGVYTSLQAAQDQTPVHTQWREVGAEWWGTASGDGKPDSEFKYARFYEIRKLELDGGVG
jgi:hypothetical protein